MVLTVQFEPGQWLDLFLPGLPQAGGFTVGTLYFIPLPFRLPLRPAKTLKRSFLHQSNIPCLRRLNSLYKITSTPEDAQPSPSNRNGYVELAVQRSSNPASAWLWQSQNVILGSCLSFRVGGSFVWPPPGIQEESIEHLLLVAGGVGIKYVQRSL